MFHTQCLSIVTKRPFSRTSNIFIFVRRKWLGFQYNAEGNGIGNFSNVGTLVAEHLFPQRVGFLDPCCYRKVLHIFHKVCILGQELRHVSLDGFQDTFHTTTNIECMIAHFHQSSIEMRFGVSWSPGSCQSIDLFVLTPI